MPLYDFVCSNNACNHEFEESVSLSEFDTKVVMCPICKCDDCDGKGDTDCNCNGTGKNMAKRRLVALKGAHTTWKNWRT